MLSVIVYGRNDSHGYNLHKRAAISLNCIAASLTHEGDEIVFVDYNTPDDLPTFVEAIRDTLTERCRSLLRVIRVRPALHARFAGRTHYAAIEAVARNVGIRRSNPGNRWILSTNTDMVFVSREGGASLSDLVAGLPNGFYQTPRLEVPETLWESLDRRDPAQAIARFGDWGIRYHLNELVHTDPVTRFDGIGDFQLVLRSDFLAIHGFNEDMLAGWNVDMNLCRRLCIRHGRVDSLADRLLAYHCGHTRLPTAIHREDTVMNDPVRYIQDVDAPELPGQAESWGLADRTLEEFRADAPPADRLRPALESVLSPMRVPYYEAWNDFTNFDAAFRLRLNAEHALAYAMDLLVTAPPSSVLGYVGGNRTLFGMVLRAWRGLGQDGAVLIPAGSALVRPDDIDAGVEVVDDEELDRRAGIFVFDFSLDDDLLDDDPYPCFQGLAEAGKARLGHVYGVFVQQVERERRRLGVPNTPARRFIGVSVVNTFFGMRFAERVVFTRTMFSTRVRHGVVRPKGPVFRFDRAPEAGDERLAAAVGRRFGLERQEIEMARGDLRHALEARRADDIDPRRCTGVVLALLDDPGVDIPPQRRENLRQWVRVRRPSHAWAPRLADAITAAGATERGSSLNTLCASEDWEDARWLAGVEEFTREGLPFRTSTYIYFKRSRGVWERGQILNGLSSLGKLTLETRCALVTDAPDGLAHFLSLRTSGVDVFDVGPGVEERRVLIARGGADPWLAKKRLFRADRLRVHHDGVAGFRRAPGEWDVVILSQNVLLADGAGRAADLLRTACDRLAEGGVLALVTEIALDGRPREGCLTPAQAMEAAALLSERSGLGAVGTFDWSISDATLDRMAVVADGTQDRPHLVTLDGGGLRTCAVWFLRKRAGMAAEDVWPLVADVMHGR